MKIRALILVSLLSACGWKEVKVAESMSKGAENAPLIDHKVKGLDGKDVALSDFRGKAMLIVNTASECGFTPQYDGLQKLYERYKDRGLVVVAFPSNDFGAQEPGTSEQIQTFCSTKFHVTFPLMEKVKTAGMGQAPVYRTLTEESPAALRGAIKWNFTKFLVDPAGHVVARFEPAVKPLDAKLVAEVEKVLPR